MDTLGRPHSPPQRQVLKQGCHPSVHLPKFRPTVCSLTLDSFDSDTANNTGGSVESAKA